jgi:hypothetical protein
LNIQETGRDSALRCPRPRGAGGTNRAKYYTRQHSFRRLTLRSATETAQRAIPTNFGVRVEPSPLFFRPAVKSGGLFVLKSAGLMDSTKTA